jgi:hypothetical protein
MQNIRSIFRGSTYASQYTSVGSEDGDLEVHRNKHLVVPTRTVSFAQTVLCITSFILFGNYWLALPLVSWVILCIAAKRIHSTTSANDASHARLLTVLLLNTLLYIWIYGDLIHHSLHYFGLEHAIAVTQLTTSAAYMLFIGLRSDKKMHTVNDDENVY